MLDFLLWAHGVFTGASILFYVQFVRRGLIEFRTTEKCEVSDG